jgi:hypothetical protein
MTSAVWDDALNMVDDKVQEFKHLGFEYLAKRPYRTELRESNDDVLFTLFADPLSANTIRAVVQAQSTQGQPRIFAHGFDLHRDGRVDELPAAALRAFL